MFRTLVRLSLLGIMSGMAGSLYAAELTVKSILPDGTPLSGMVVSLTPTNPDLIPPLDPKLAPAVMDQVDMQFVPYLLVVQKGSRVTFPNSDSIKHHVYSFSEAKPFQLRLYKNREPSPLAFEKPGVVALGCNIHDWMVGYIYVSESPWFARTNPQGEVRLDVPDGEYRLKVWFPLMKDKDMAREKVISLSGQQQEVWQLLENLHPKENSEQTVEEFDAY